MDLEQILRLMAEDRTYVPPVDIASRGKGVSSEYRAAKNKLRQEIPNFDELISRNISFRKKQKLKQKLQDDPEFKQVEMAKKAERRRTRRAAKLEDKVNLTPNEKFLNYQQSLITRQLNDKIKANPNIVLDNPELMDKLSTTVSREGDIIKVKPNLSDIKNRGIFEIEHQRDIYKKGAMKDFPYNRNLTLGPYNRAGGFKDAAEKFITNNPDSPKVNSILEKANELNITLQPDVPKGTFATKGIGYKQTANAVDKFIDVAKNTIPEIVDNKIGLAGSTKDLKFAKIALGLPKNFALPAVAGIVGYNALTGGEAQAAEPRSDITYNKDIGAFTKTEDQDGVIAPVKVNQAGMLDWVAENPIEVSLGATGVGAVGTKTGRELSGKLIKGILKTLGSPLVGAAFAGTEIADRLTSDKELTPGEEAISNLSISSSFLFPEIAKRGGAVFGPLLNLGRVGSMFTPIGLGLTAASAAKFMYDDYQKRSAELEKEKLDPNYIEPQYRTDFEGGA